MGGKICLPQSLSITVWRNCRTSVHWQTLPLGISKATAYRMAEQGRIPCIRLGRRIVLSKNHLEQWIDHEVGFESNKEVIEHGETHQG